MVKVVMLESHFFNCPMPMQSIITECIMSTKKFIKSPMGNLSKSESKQQTKDLGLWMHACIKEAGEEFILLFAAQYVLL